MSAKIASTNSSSPPQPTRKTQHKSSYTTILKTILVFTSIVFISFLVGGALYLHTHDLKQALIIGSIVAITTIACALILSSSPSSAASKPKRERRKKEPHPPVIHTQVQGQKTMRRNIRQRLREEAPNSSFVEILKEFSHTTNNLLLRTQLEGLGSWFSLSFLNPQNKAWQSLPFVAHESEAKLSEVAIPREYYQNLISCDERIKVFTLTVCVPENDVRGGIFVPQIGFSFQDREEVTLDIHTFVGPDGLGSSSKLTFLTAGHEHMTTHLMPDSDSHWVVTPFRQKRPDYISILISPLKKDEKETFFTLRQPVSSVIKTGAPMRPLFKQNGRIQSIRTSTEKRGGDMYNGTFSPLHPPVLLRIETVLVRASPPGTSTPYLPTEYFREIEETHALATTPI